MYCLVKLIERSICSKKVVEDFWDVHFSCVTVEGRVFDSNLDIFCSFSGNMFAVSFHFPKVEGMVIVSLAGISGVGQTF